MFPKSATTKGHPSPPKRRRPSVPGAAILDPLIEEAITDAYGESEQAVGFLTMLQQNLVLPFKTEVLGVEVTVREIDITDDDQIVAVCMRGKVRQRVPLLDLPLPSPPPAGSEWIHARRRWARGQ